jgi:ankyrin repeat protein
MLKEGKTALHKAVEQNNAEICQFLIERGSDPNLQDKVNIESAIYDDKYSEEILVKFACLDNLIDNYSLFVLNLQLK